MSIEAVMPSKHLTLCHPLLLLPSIFHSIRVFSNESVLHIKWPKYWSFSFSISPSNEYSGLISFRIGLVGFPCSPRDSQESFPTPQFKSINSSAIAFFIVQFSHPYMTTGNIIDQMDLCWQSNISAFNMLSTLVIAFLPRSTHLLISWLHTICSDFGAPKSKV